MFSGFSDVEHSKEWRAEINKNKQMGLKYLRYWLSLLLPANQNVGFFHQQYPPKEYVDNFHVWWNW